MPLICYTPKRFQASTLKLIDVANEIIKEYAQQGFNLTLRQLYYQFVARDLFPDSWIDASYNLKNGLPPDTKKHGEKLQTFGWRHQ